MVAIFAQALLGQTHPGCSATAQYARDYVFVDVDDATFVRVSAGASAVGCASTSAPVKERRTANCIRQWRGCQRARRPDSTAAARRCKRSCLDISLAEDGFWRPQIGLADGDASHGRVLPAQTLIDQA